MLFKCSTFTVSHYSESFQSFSQKQMLEDCLKSIKKCTFIPVCNDKESNHAHPSRRLDHGAARDHCGLASLSGHWFERDALSADINQSHFAGDLIHSLGHHLRETVQHMIDECAALLRLQHLLTPGWASCAVAWLSFVLNF